MQVTELGFMGHLKKNNIFALKLLRLERKYGRDYKLFTQIWNFGSDNFALL